MLETRAIKKYFPISRGWLSFGEIQSIKAVDGVDIIIHRGETVGMVGESGCGKSTIVKLILLLEALTAGEILFEGENIATFNGKALAYYRRSVQVVFQNPYSSLNPRMRIGNIISEPLRANTNLSKQEMQKKVEFVLELVGLDPTAASKFPHEFSGGQRQRIAIARALACDPRLIVLDEPVSSQDVSIQAQLLNLLKVLQSQYNISYLFIGHDLATVRFMSDRIIVMYLGEIVESGTSDEICENPMHPYTKALLAASLPDYPDPLRERETLRGEIPSPLNPPGGCRFHTRCPVAMPECATVPPKFIKITETRSVACHLHK